jgi:outer membrane protein
MKKPVLRPLVAAILVALPLAIPATADAQNWLIRARVIDIAPDVSSSINGLDVKEQWAPELDFTYFFSKNLAAELILGTARHKVTLDGVGDIGKVSHLPPTVTFQYHFTDLGAAKPYVGAGINLTYFYDVGLRAGSTELGLSDNWSFGGALQAGLDYEISKNLYLNVDVKRLWIKNDVTVAATGDKIGDLKIDPWVFGLGIGWRF